MSHVNRALNTACYIFILTMYCDDVGRHVMVSNIYVAIIAETFITVYGIITILKCCKKKCFHTINKLNTFFSYNKNN